MSYPNGEGVLIVGLGDIGLNYDLVAEENDPRRTKVGPTIRTHAAAVSACDATRLVGGVDPHPEQRVKFESAFGRPTWSRFDEVPRKGIEIVVIAVPTDLHLEVATSAIANFSPRLLVCEKPVGRTSADTRALFAAAHEKQTAVVVNYFRHYLPNLRRVREQLRGARFGELLGGTVLYSHGLRRNGSHFIALLLWLFGEAAFIGRIEMADPASDPSFALKVGTAAVNYSSIGHGSVRSGELCLGFTQGLLRISSGGSKISWSTVDRPRATLTPSYSTDSWELLDDLHDCQLPLYRQVTLHAETRQESLESMSVALRTQELMDEILNETS